MTAGGLTAFALVNNGLMLGTTFAVLQRYGGADYLATFILAHGPLELSAITLAAGAGLRLAWAMLHPDELSRAESLRLGAAQALRMMALVVSTLVLAGAIEAFVSPTTIDLRVKLGVGLVTGALLWAYILKGLPLRASAESAPDSGRSTRP